MDKTDPEHCLTTESQKISAKVSMFAVKHLLWTKAHYILLVLIIVLTGAAQVYLFKQGFYSISADEIGRTLFAAEIPFSRLIKPVISWLPLHLLINKLGLMIYYDLLLTPRILSSIAGIVTSIALMFLAYRLFGNSTISIITGILAICFPQRLVFSVAPMGEIYCMCFMTLGFAFVLGWITEGMKRDLFFSTICFMLYSALRYEGWIVCATMASMLTIERFISRKMDWTTYLIAIAILSSFPLYWLLSAYFTKSMHLFSFVSKYYIDLYGKDVMKVWERSFLYQVIDQSVYSPLIAGLVTFMCQVVYDKNVRIWSLLFVIPVFGMTILGFLTYSLPLHNFWRLAGPTLILLLPFLAHFIYTVCPAISINRPAHYILLTILTSLFVMGFYSETAKRTKSSYMTGEDLMAGNFLKTLDLDGMDKILIDSSSRNYGTVIIGSNMPERFIENIGPEPFYPKPAVLDLTKEIDVKFLKIRGIKYLVFKTSQGLRYEKPHYVAKVKAQNLKLRTCRGLRIIKQIGEWGIFAVQ